MSIDHPLIQTLLPRRQGENNSGVLPRTLVTGNATGSALKLKVCRIIWMMKQELRLQVIRGLKPGKNPLSDKCYSRCFSLRIVGTGEAVEFGDSDVFTEAGEVEQNELLESSINPLQIGYRIEDFEDEVTGLDTDSNHGGGDGGGGNDGGCGSGGNGGEGHGGLEESSDGLTGLKWWWLWQWNRAVRAQKRGQNTLHLRYNDRNRLIGLAVQLLAAEVMPPRDMAKAALLTLTVIEDLMPLLLQVLMFPIIFPLQLSHFQENEHIFSATFYTMMGVSLAAATVLSGAVIYGFWRWHKSYQNRSNHDDSEDSIDPEYDDPPVH